MNKFLTILRVLLLVASSHEITWSEMTGTQTNLEARPLNSLPSSGLPTTLDFSRFAALGKKSPFTLASTTEEAADFAKDLVLAGFVRLEGEDYVMVAYKTKPQRFLVGKKPSLAAEEMILLEVKRDPSGDPTKMEARIKKKGEIATLKYEVTGGGTPPPNVAGAQPGAPAPGGPTIPGLPGQVAPGQAGGAQGKIPNPTVIRRRVIPIPNRVGK